MEKIKPYFRVKVNLSQIFNDHRKISWILVDTTKVLHIEHLKEHISKIFDIAEPFYLLLDSIYLPCKEDVRIVQSDNPITLILGASVNSSVMRECPDGNSLKTNFSQMSNAQVSTFDGRKVQSDEEEQDDLYSPKSDINMTVLSGKSFPGTTNNTMYHSILEDPEAVSLEESETLSFKESKENDSLMTEDSSFNATTPAKRKRARRKKVKRLDDKNSSAPMTPPIEHRKPKIINDVILGTGKHIRFSTQDEVVTSPSSCIPKTFEFPNKLNNSFNSEQSPGGSLNALLSLKQCSTPLTFSCKKVEKQVKVETPTVSVLKNNGENLNDSKKSIVSSNGTEKFETYCDLQLENIEVENCPPLAANPKINDVVAFKIFKMGNDYTPQVSEYIVGMIVNIHPITALCTIKVLRGHKEIEEPQGKLTLPTDEDEVPSNLIKLNFNQLLEARLIFRKE